MKICIKCQEKKLVTQFNFKNKARRRRNARCKTCTRKDIMVAYYKKHDYYLKYRAQRNRKLQKKSAKFIYDYLSNHQCVDCKIKDPTVLQFDHVLGKKLANVSELSNGRYPIKIIINEIKKCVVRCANCHARKTAKERNYYQYVSIK
jgi:hypothetical protein